MKKLLFSLPYCGRRPHRQAALPSPPRARTGKRRGAGGGRGREGIPRRQAEAPCLHLSRRRVSEPPNPATLVSQWHQQTRVTSGARTPGAWPQGQRSPARAPLPLRRGGGGPPPRGSSLRRCATNDGGLGAVPPPWALTEGRGTAPPPNTQTACGTRELAKGPRQDHSTKSLTVYLSKATFYISTRL